MTAAGFTIPAGIHPIVPVMIGDARLAAEMAADLLDEGIYVVGFSYPVVPKGDGPHPGAALGGPRARGCRLRHRGLRRGRAAPRAWLDDSSRETGLGAEPAHVPNASVPPTSTVPWRSAMIDERPATRPAGRPSN